VEAPIAGSIILAENKFISPVTMDSFLKVYAAAYVSLVCI